MNKILVYLFIMTLMTGMVTAVTSYAVWQDMNDDGTPDTFIGYVQPYDHGTDVTTAYNYYSWSSHMSDPAPEAYISKLWLYDHDEFSLGMFHNIDAGGSPHNVVAWELSVEGTNSHVILSDDAFEFKAISPHFYKGTWQYWKNTDGGVLGINNTGSWTVKIHPVAWGDVEAWEFYSSDDTVLTLDKDHDVYITNKEYDEPEDVPEFGVVAAALVLIGAGLFIHKKRKN